MKEQPLMFTLRTFTLTVVMLAVGIVLGSVLTLTGQANANAGEPVPPLSQSTAVPCKALWMHDHTTADEDRCRDLGWQVSWRFIRSAGGHRMWTGVGPCRFDEVVQGEHCYWNARTMGNGMGESFVHLGHLGVFTGLYRINGVNAKAENHGVKIYER